MSFVRRGPRVGGVAKLMLIGRRFCSGMWRRRGCHLLNEACSLGTRPTLHGEPSVSQQGKHKQKQCLVTEQDSYKVIAQINGCLLLLLPPLPNCMELRFRMWL